jgi:DNA-binding response OmpR family regulator
MSTDSPRILVVDDEPHLRNVLQRILGREGYNVTTAPDGETALGLIREQEPDLVLLDLMMPGLDGREVRRRLRSVSETTHVIYFTGKALPSDAQKRAELRQEVDAFIPKPATSKQVLEKVHAVLRREAA